MTPGTACAVLCLVTQSCLTLCDPMDCGSPGFSFQGVSPGKNIGVCYQALLQGIFPIQEWNWGLLFCRWFFTSWATRQAPVPAYVDALWKFLEFKTYGKPVLEPYSQNTGIVVLVFNNFPLYSALIHQEQNAMVATHLLGEIKNAHHLLTYL